MGWNHERGAAAKGTAGGEHKLISHVNPCRGPLQLPQALLCEFCSWVTVAMKGCCAMWPGDCCIRGCWCGLCSCWENCTGCRAARLPATLLMTGTL